MRIRAFRLAAVFACVAAVATVHADWNGVAATAAIDERDLGKVVFNSDGSAGIRPTISSTSAKLRLQLPKTPSLLVGNPRPSEVGELVFVMRVRDNGSGARVIATLKRVTLGYFIVGPQRSDVAATIDSDLNLNPPSDEWVTVSAQQYSSCCWIRDPNNFSIREELDFFDAGWFVEVQLIKNSAEGNPGVMSVAVLRDEP
jgi:hypothetical protein